jgi:hypothetical protein
MKEMRELFGRGTGMASQILQLRQDASSEFSASRDQLKADTDETLEYMRVLHEDVLMRLKLIGEDNDSDS